MAYVFSMAAIDLAAMLFIGISALNYELRMRALVRNMASYRNR